MFTKILLKVVVRVENFGIRYSKVPFKLCCLDYQEAWAGYSVSLHFCLHSYKMGVITGFTGFP